MAATAASTPAAPAAEEIDAIVAKADAAAATWAQVGPGERAAMLERLAERVDGVAEEWVAAATAAKAGGPEETIAAEEWASGPWAFITGVRALAETLRTIDAGKPVFKDGAIHERPDGQLVVDVYPTNLLETLLLNGYTAQVWQDPALTRSELREHVAALYQSPREAHGVSAVMGAGNIASITPLDIVYALMADGFTVVAKLSPINDYLHPYLERAFEEFISNDWVALVGGDASTGERLVTHPKVRAVHVTGAATTHDAIVFGTGPEAEARRAAGESRLDKPVTAELGGVTPTIVVPGDWSDRDLRFQAEHIATQKLHNAGHNCVAAQMVILPADWSLVDRFTDILTEVLQTVPARDQYYPGSDVRHEQMLKIAPTSKPLGGGSPSRLLAELDERAHEQAFTTEAFGTFLGVVRLPGDTDAFLEAATDFANDKLIGTLGINVLVDPATAKEHAPALDAAIAKLRYGSIGVNAWVGVGFLLARATWGAFPGATPSDIQSGTGVVHNAYLFERPQKTVVHGPFRPFPYSFARGQFTMAPKPPWFVTNRTAATTGERLTHLAAKPSLQGLAGVFVSALRG